MRISRLIPAALLSAAIALGVVAAAAPASAEESAGGATTWSVVPANADGPDGRRWIENTVDPGSTTQDYMAVRNFSEAPVTFKLSAADGYFTDRGRFSMNTADVPSTKAGTWISLQPEVTVDPGATAVVPITITVPANATPGDHAAGVAASVFSGGGNGTGVSTESRVGFRVMLRVTGELRPAAKVVGLTGTYETQWNPFSPGRVDVAYGARNEGNVQLQVDGTVDAGGKRGTEPLDGRDLLVDDTVKVTDRALGVWPLGPVEVTVHLTAQPKGPDGKPDPDADPVTTTATTTVWAMPWPQLIVLAAAALIVFGLLWGRRSSKRRIAGMLAEARAEGAREASKDA